MKCGIVFKRKYRTAFLSFLFSLLVMTAVYAFAHIAPFGNETVVFCDSAGQYISFLAYMRDVLLGRQNVFYSFEKTIGGNIIGVLAYYCMSPFNILLPLFSLEKLPLAANLIVLLKVSACAFTMSLFLEDITEGAKTVILVAAAYAFCGYCLEFYWCIMWLDGVILLPLIALGLRKIIRGESALPYCLSLAVSIIINYYIGFMLCVFSVLYFLYLAYLNGNTLRDLFRPTVQFAVHSILAGGISSVVLLPVVYAMKGGKREAFMPFVRWHIYSTSLKILEILFPGKADHFDFMTKYVLLASLILLAICFAGIIYFLILDKTGKKPFFAVIALTLLLAVYGAIFNKTTPFLYKLVSGFTDLPDMVDGTPAIYSSVLIFVCAAAYFLSDKIPIKSKTAALCFIGIILLSLRFYIPNLVWHGFTENRCFNYRYSFIFSFFLCSLAAEYLNDGFKLRPLHAGLISAFSVLLLFLGRETIVIDRIQNSFVFGAASTVIICVCLCFGDRLYLCRKNAAVAIIAVIHIAGLVYPAALNMRSYTNPEAEYDIVTLSEFTDKTIVDKAESDLVNSLNDGFYRVSINYESNAPMMYGFKGISHFSSAESTAVVDFLERTGITTLKHVWSSASAGRTRTFESFFGLKYFNTNEGFYKAIETAPSLYENPYALQIAFTAEPAVIDWMQTDDPFESFNKLFEAAAGISEPVFSKADIALVEKRVGDEDDVLLHYRVNCVGENCMYLFFKNTNPGDAEIFLNGELIADYRGVNGSVIHELGIIESGDEIVICVPEAEAGIYDDNLLIYSENLDSLSAFYELLSKDPCVITCDKDSHVNVNVSVDHNKLLMFTIPYDKAWRVSVDGKTVQTQKAGDMFLAIPVSTGCHEVEMNYYPEGITAGTVICVVSVMLAAAAELLRKKKN